MASRRRRPGPLGGGRRPAKDTGADHCSAAPPGVATPDEIGSFCCDVFWEERTGWIHRRKETVEIHSETLLRHQTSVDFNVPHALPAPAPRHRAMHYVPLVVLRKEPGRFTRFDVKDETGRSVPLPTRVRNAEVSRWALVEAARRTASRRGTTLPDRVRAELGFIATADGDAALAFARRLYLEPERRHQDADAPVRAELMRDERLKWLLRTLALGSIVLLKIEGEAGERRVIRLSYDEVVAQVTGIRRRRMLAMLGALSDRLGWRGYWLEVQSLFIGARNYHFELHSPPGLQVIEAGMSTEDPVSDDPHRVHLYLPSAEGEQSSFVYAQFRVRGPGFVGAAALTAIVIVAALGGVWSFADRLAGTTASAAPLLLLFPGLVAGYLARPAHPLVTRLLNLARLALIGCAACAYVGAARLAVATSEHPATEHSIVVWFRWLTAVAAGCTLALIAARFLPLRSSHPLRRLARRLKPGPARPRAAE